MISSFQEKPLLIKISTGEEILAEKITEKNGVVILHNPYYVVKILRENKLSFQLDRWMPYTEGVEIPIDKNHIISYNPPTEDFFDYYQSIIKMDSEEELLQDEEYTGQIH